MLNVNDKHPKSQDLYTEYIAQLHNRKDSAFNELKKVKKGCGINWRLIFFQIFAELPEVLEKFHEAREDMTITG